MKNLFSILALTAFIALGFTFQSCKKTDLSNEAGIASIQLGLRKHADSTFAVYKTFSGITWKISSETVSPAKNGTNVVTLDSCNTKVTYNFSAFLDSSYSVSGPITIHYFNSPCSAFLRGRNIDPNPQTNSYMVNTFSSTFSTLTFADNGYDLITNTYRIVSSSQTALVLQITKAGYTYTKTYLPVQ